MRFWKLSSLPDLDDMAPTPLEKRPPRPGELLLAAGAAFFAAGLGATFLTTFLAAKDRPGERRRARAITRRHACGAQIDARVLLLHRRHTPIHNQMQCKMKRKSMRWRSREGWTMCRAPCDERDESDQPVQHD